MYNLLQLPIPLHLDTIPLHTCSSTARYAFAYGLCERLQHGHHMRRMHAASEALTAVQAAKGKRTRAMALLQVKCSNDFP